MPWQRHDYKRIYKTVDFKIYKQNMEDNIELKLIGITYNQIESGVYALILEDPVMKRRLAIVIGYPEAQSIECKLQNVRTPRPLAHDLLANLLNTLSARLIRVDIHRLPSGPYAGKLIIENIMGERFEVDSRSSDAIALAIRVGAPIYTNKELLEKEGYIPQKVSTKQNAPAKKEKEQDPYKNYTDAQLEKLISDYVAEENYEAAAEIKRELQRRLNSDTNND